MNKMFVVARWEYVEKVRSKAFLFGLFFTPMIMVAMGVLPGLLAGKEDESTRIIGVIDGSGEIAKPLAGKLERELLPGGNPKYIVKVIGSGKDINLQQLTAVGDEMVKQDDIIGYVILGANALRDTSMEYRSKGAGDFRLIGTVRKAVESIIAERRFAERGIDKDLMKELSVSLDVKTVKISERGEEETSFLKTFFSAYVFLMALFFLVLTSGQLLVRSVLEEKSNRIIEVLVSSCTPSELMFGKVLGLSALGLTQMAFWGVLALAIAGQFGETLLPPLNQMLLILVYFVLGYLLFSAIFIAFGSPVTTEQEAQQLTGYLVMVVILPVALVVPVMQQPNAVWVKIMSFIPLLTPSFMVLRIPVQFPAWWEIAGTIVVLVVSTWFMMFVAGRIFRIAILATGKRPGVKELLRWVRSG